jgi:hypothetical protein
MDEKINFVEIAEKVVANFRDNISVPELRYYVHNPLFVLIDEEENIRVSFLPDVLNEAKECMIILTYNNKNQGSIYYYPHYKVFRIKDDGMVQEGYSKEGWKIYITGTYYTSPSQILLSKDKTSIFCSHWKGEESLYEVWRVYKKCKECETATEAKLIGENSQLLEEIETLKGKNKELELLNKIAETTKKQYKDLLEEIKSLLEEKGIDRENNAI